MNQDIQTLKRQLLQLKELHDAGALSTPQYEESRTALERRLLDLVLSGSDVDNAGASTALTSSVAGDSPVSTRSLERLSPGLVAVLAVVVLGIAGAGYWWMGSPSSVGLEPAGLAGAEGRPGGSGPSHPTSAEQIEAMSEKLSARLKEQPDDAEGWAMLGRSFTVLGRHPEALKAYERAVALRDDDGQLLADYADSLAVKNNRTLAGEPMKWVEKALKLDPRNLKALSLAGTHAFDRKDYAGAVKYWDQVVQFGPSDSNYVEQLQASLAEARELGGLPAASKPASATAAPVGLPGNSVSGTVSLAPALAKQVSPDDTVFIFARAADGKGMPLAILRKKVKDLPMQFTLDDSLAMSPAAKISGATSVIVGARISKTGEAMPQNGDLSGQTGPVNLGASALKLDIRDVVKQ